MERVNKTLKKIMMSFLVVFPLVLLLSCASKKPATPSTPPVPRVYTDGESIIIITRYGDEIWNSRTRQYETASTSNISINLLFNGKDIGNINVGQSITLTVPNGKHSLIASGAGVIARYTVDLNNEREEIYTYLLLDSGKIDNFILRSSSKIALPQSPALDEKAIIQSFNTLNALISSGKKIAILNISSSNKNDEDFVMEELMILFVNARKYVVVDRQTLETIRQEQRFQMTGDVSDDSAVQIGAFLGADVVITGSITGSGDQRRLRLRALDVKTAQVIAMSSEKI